MKKKIIVTEQQLNKYLEKKKAEKTFTSIMEELYKNSKFLKENISLETTKKSVLEKYKNKGELTEQVISMLKNYNIVNNADF
jgi:hypothetical protein